MWHMYSHTRATTGNCLEELLSPPVPTHKRISWGIHVGANTDTCWQIIYVLGLPGSAGMWCSLKEGALNKVIAPSRPFSWKLKHLEGLGESKDLVFFWV